MEMFHLQKAVACITNFQSFRLRKFVKTVFDIIVSKIDHIVIVINIPKACWYSGLKIVPASLHNYYQQFNCSTCF